MSLLVLAGCELDQPLGRWKPSYQLPPGGGFIVWEDGGAPIDSGHPDGSTPTDGGADGGIPFPLTGDGGPLTFTRLAAPIVPRFSAVHGSGPDRIFIGSADGKLYRYDGQQWTGMLDAMETIHEILVQGPAVYLAAEESLLSCDQGCDQPANYVRFPTYPEVWMKGLCTAPDGTLFAVGHTPLSVGALYRRDGQGWTQLLLDAKFDRPLDCAVTARGELFAATREEVFRYDLASGNWEMEEQAVRYPFHQWNSIGVLGEVVLVAGEDRFIMQRLPDGTWQEVFNPGKAGGGGTYYTFAASNHEWLALGEDYATTSQMVLFDGRSWQFSQARFPASILDAWFAADGELYLVGDELPNSGPGAIFRGTR